MLKSEYNHQFPSLFKDEAEDVFRQNLHHQQAMKNVECGNANPGKPDMLAGNVLQQQYNFHSSHQSSE